MAFVEPLGKFFVAIGMETSEFRKELARSQAMLRRAFGGEALALSRNIAGAVAAATGALGALSVYSVKVAADLEDQAVAFTRLLGSAQAADRFMREMKEFALRTPFQYTDLLVVSKRLMAFGFEANKVKSILTSLGDAASALGVGQDVIDRMAYSIGQIKQLGYVATRELRELATAGLPVWDILAHKLGVKIPQAMKMVEAKAVSSKVALDAIFAGIDERYGGMMEERSKTINGILSNIQDSVTQTTASVGQALTDAFDLKKVLTRVMDELGTFRTNVESMGLRLAFDKMFGEEVKAGVFLLAGAITGSLVPALYSLGVSATAAITPLLPLIGAGVAVGNVAYMAYTILNIKSETDKLNSSTEELTNQLRQMGTVGAQALARMELAALKARRAMLVGESGEVGDIDSKVKELSEAAGKRSQFYNSKKTNMLYWLGHSMVSELSTGGATRERAEAERLLGVKKELLDIDEKMAKATGSINSYRMMKESRYDLMQKLTLMAGGFGGTGYKPKEKLPEEDLSGKNVKTKESVIKAMDREHDMVLNLGAAYREAIGLQTKITNATQAFHEALSATAAAGGIGNLGIGKTLGRSENKAIKDRIGQEYAEYQVALAKSQSEYLRDQMEEERVFAETQYAKLEALRTGLTLREQMEKDYQAANLASAKQHFQAKDAAFLQSIQGQRDIIKLREEMLLESNRAMSSYLAEGARFLYDGIGGAISSIVTGSQTAAQAVQELGKQLIAMVVKWMVQRKLAAMMAVGLETATSSASVAAASVTAAAWAPAAAMVAAATFGQSTIAAAAGLTSLNAMARGLAIPGLAKGGIVTRPTIALIGEGSGPEAVVPLDRLGGMGGNVQVKVNVHNNTGVPSTASTQTTRNGQEVIVDLFLDAFARNVGGLRSAMGR